MTKIFRHPADSLSMLVIPLLIGLAACTSQRLSTLPAQLSGEWRTADARYQGRSMNVATDHITFGMGGIAPDRLERVEGVQLVNSDKAQEYRITLRTSESSPDTLILEFTQDNGGELHIKSQPGIVWRRNLKAVSAPTVVGPQTPEAQPEPVILSSPLLMHEHKIIYKVDCVRPKICKSY